MAGFLTSPLTDVISGGGGVWVTYDASALVPVGATGVMLHVRNKDAVTDRDWGIRATGSSDTQTGHMQAASSEFFFVKLNGSLQFDYYTENGTTGFEAYLIGYFESEATWFTDAKSYAYSSPSSGWKTHDVSDNVPAGAVAAICYYVCSSSQKFGVRKNGSVWNPTSPSRAWWAGHDIGYIAPLSVDRKFDQFHNAETSKTIYVVGYLTDGVFPDTPTDISLGLPINVWQSVDLATDPNKPASGNTGALIHVGSLNVYFGGLMGGVRGAAITEDLNQGHGNSHYCVPITDLSAVISGRVNNLGIDFFVMGYFASTGGGGGGSPTMAERMRQGKWFHDGEYKGYFLG